jgi:2-oxoglutarate dehydrogenase E1 component
VNATSRNSLLEFFADTSFLNSGSAAYVEALADQYEHDPALLSEDWRSAFGEIALRRLPGLVDPAAREAGVESARDAAALLQLIQAFRTHGHLEARIDPLGLAYGKNSTELSRSIAGVIDSSLDRLVFLGGVCGLERATLCELTVALRERYCGPIGYEYMHIGDATQRQWLQDRIEAGPLIGPLQTDEKLAILEKLVQVKGYERYLDKKFVGTTRFGLDGAEATIPAIEAIIGQAAEHGVIEVTLGMAHRGRLNVLVQVLRKSPRAIFHEFKGGLFFPENMDASGDVKYHLGASADRQFDGRVVHLSLAANPSHLEIIDPVVLGKARAKQDQNADRAKRISVLPLLVHGDAAFAGQGVVAECFALSGLQGYRTGGSVHLIVNNQVGFTTNPSDSRSSRYSSDLAKTVDAPIFHLNGDDPEAVVAVSRLAVDFRQAFGKPVVIDLVCFRYYGHNEGDEPAFTQPEMYKVIRSHPSTLEIYAGRLQDEGTVTSEALAMMKSSWQAFLDEEFDAGQTYVPDRADWLRGRWEGLQSSSAAGEECSSAVELDRLIVVGKALASLPEGFTVHPTVGRFLSAREKSIAEGTGIDWSTAEALALGTLVNEGTPVRMAGQDTERGTFSQRHAVLNDQVTGERYVPIAAAAKDSASFEIINTLLSEEAVLAYEYGYTLAAPHTLVLWEAQFGDFANGAQVVFDQFVASGQSKWLRMSGLVCLLPHGFDGQGPEHSSARLERFLQSSAEDNWQVVNCTTPANYFHLLRRQVRRSFRKPLIVMTPKSLLRHPRCKSAMNDFAPGTSFVKVLLDDADRSDVQTELLPDVQIRRVIACSGKIYFDLLEERIRLGRRDVYLLRVEQLYPFPEADVSDVLARFPAAELVWCQEEPKNMGAWSFVEPCLEQVRNRVGSASSRPTYVGRRAAASPAVGTSRQHQEQLVRLLVEAFA